MTATILIATRNPHKVSEIRAILGPQFDFLALNDFPEAPKVVEDADTFAGNAKKKAVELANWLVAGGRDGALRHRSPREAGGTARVAPPGVPVIPDYVLADDSGLEVDALNGAPGVHSARFAALNKDQNSPDADNNAKLLRLLKEVPEGKRTARFRCVLALAPVLSPRAENSSPVCYAEEPELPTQLFDGACEGRIIPGARGENGFGYDPLFVPNGFEETFAELGEDVKNKLSHRARALEKLKEFFSHFQPTTEPRLPAAAPNIPGILT